MGFGLGTQTPTAKKEDKGAHSSSKIELIQGDIPRYKGDRIVSMVEVVEPMVVTVIGPPGIGKSHFALTFPDPAMCDTEMKGEKIWRKFYRGNAESYKVDPTSGEVVPYKWDQSAVTPQNSRLFHSEDWGDVASFYDSYEKREDVSTLVFDSETDLREYAELWTLNETGKATLYGGKDAGTKPFSLVYGKLKYILLNGKKSGKHLVYTSKEKALYKNDKATGEMGAAGYNNQHFYSGYVLHMQLGIKTKDGQILYPKHVFAKVVKAENMKPGFYPPSLIECTFRGLVNELVRGKEWTGTDEEFVRDVVAPRMKEQGIER